MCLCVYVCVRTGCFVWVGSGGEHLFVYVGCICGKVCHLDVSVMCVCACKLVVLKVIYVVVISGNVYQ